MPSYSMQVTHDSPDHLDEYADDVERVLNEIAAMYKSGLVDETKPVIHQYNGIIRALKLLPVIWEATEEKMQADGVEACKSDMLETEALIIDIAAHLLMMNRCSLRNIR